MLGQLALQLTSLDHNSDNTIEALGIDENRHKELHTLVLMSVSNPSNERKTQVFEAISKQVRSSNELVASLIILSKIANGL